MAKKKKPVEINRNKYNQIRKMDHSTMEACIGGYYEQGFDAGYKLGQAAAGSFNTGIALAAISQIKGIGPVKLEQIHLAMVAAGAKDIGKQLDEMEAELKQMAAGGQDA